MKKQLVSINQEKVDRWEREMDRTVVAVKKFYDAFRAMNIGDLTTEELHSAIQDPAQFYESRLMSLVDIPEVSGPLKIDKAKYMSTLEKPDTDALMKAHDAITNDHIARTSYSGTLLEEGKVQGNPILRKRQIEVYSLYAETPQQAQAWEKHQEFCEAFNEYNEFLAESGLARTGDLHKLWDIPSFFTWIPGERNYVPNYEHFSEIKRRSIKETSLA